MNQDVRDKKDLNYETFFPEVEEVLASIGKGNQASLNYQDLLHKINLRITLEKEKRDKQKSFKQRALDKIYSITRDDAQGVVDTLAGYGEQAFGTLTVLANVVQKLIGFVKHIPVLGPILRFINSTKYLREKANQKWFAWSEAEKALALTAAVIGLALLVVPGISQFILIGVSLVSAVASFSKAFRKDYERDEELRILNDDAKHLVAQIQGYEKEYQKDDPVLNSRIVQAREELAIEYIKNRATHATYGQRTPVIEVMGGLEKGIGALVVLGLALMLIPGINFIPIAAATFASSVGLGIILVAIGASIAITLYRGAFSLKKWWSSRDSKVEEKAQIKRANPEGQEELKHITSIELPESNNLDENQQALEYMDACKEKIDLYKVQVDNKWKKVLHEPNLQGVTIYINNKVSAYNKLQESCQERLEELQRLPKENNKKNLMSDDKQSLLVRYQRLLVELSHAKDDAELVLDSINDEKQSRRHEIKEGFFATALDKEATLASTKDDDASRSGATNADSTAGS